MRKIRIVHGYVCVLIIAVAIMLPVRAVALCGDVSGDGAILSNDILMVARAALGTLSLDAAQNARADCVSSTSGGSPDGSILSNDLLLVARAALGMVTLSCSENSGQRISGTVSAPSGVPLGRNAGRTASATGLEAKASVPVEAYLIDDSGIKQGDTLASTTTNASGAYSLTLPSEISFSSNLIVIVGSGNNTMRAIAFSMTINISPISEIVTSEIVASTQPLSNFSVTEVGEIQTRVENDASGVDFSTAVSVSAAVVILDTGQVAANINTMITQAGDGTFENDVCGNGLIETGETCDDGNTIVESCTYGQTSCTVCGSSCASVAGVISYCGDNTTNGAEQCDAGAGNTNTVCAPATGENCTYCDTSCISHTVMPLATCEPLWTNTIWTKANSPYILDCSVVIPDGITLNIEPGVTVFYTGANSTIEVHGAIIANGTASDAIAFTTSRPGQNSYATMIDFKSDSDLNLSRVSYIMAKWGTSGLKNETATGTLNVSNSIFSNNLNSGIYNSGGALNVTNSTFSNNTGGFGLGGSGIVNGNSGSMTVTNSTFSNNRANVGGGINNGGNMTVTNSTFSNNSADGGGGGISNDYGNMTVTNSTFTNNSTYSGGGIANGYGNVTVTNSIFTNNSANYQGGGIHNGGIMTVTNSTFSNNSGYGNGIYNGDNGSMTVSNSTFNSTSGLSGAAIFLYYGRKANITYSDISGYAIGVEGTPITFNHNNIYNNSEGNFKITEAINVPAANNYWGTTDTDAINLKIFDYYDDNNLGRVLYTPILTVPEPTAGDPD